MTTTRIRASKGFAYESRGRFLVRITVAPQTRQEALLPWCASLTSATERAHAIQALVNQLRRAEQIRWIQQIIEQGAAEEGVLPDLTSLVQKMLEGMKLEAVPESKDGPLTIEKLGGQWTDGTLHRLHPDHIKAKRTSYDDSRRLGILCGVILPDGRRFGDLTPAEVLLDVADAVMSRLDATRAARVPKGKRFKPLRQPARRQYAQMLSFLLGAAAYPLRLIKASPLPKGWLPNAKTRVRPTLYPDEELQTMKATDNAIHWRIFYGFQSRTGFRVEETVSLNMRDAHFDKRVIELDENKTDDPRAPVFDASLFRALEWWRDHYRKGAKPEDPLFIRPDGNRIRVDGGAAFYRETFLRAAKIDREKLFRETDLETKVCQHSCRANFVTYSLAAGKTETWIADRTGHKSSAMINRYRRKARNVVEAGLGLLTPLDEAIPEIADTNVSANVSAETKHVDEEANARYQNHSSNGLIAQSVELRTFNSRTSSTFNEFRDDSDTVDGFHATSLALPTRSADTNLLRAKLDKAITAEAWDAVRAIKQRIDEIERADVIDLEVERAAHR